MTKKKLITAVACSALVLSIGAVSAFAATGNLGNAEAKGGSVAFDGSAIEDDGEVMVTDTLPEGVGEMIGQGTVMLKEEDGKLYSSSDDGATWSENLEETIGFKDGTEYTSGSFDNNGNAVPKVDEICHIGDAQLCGHTLELVIFSHRKAVKPFGEIVQLIDIHSGIFQPLENRPVLGDIVHMAITLQRVADF